MRKEVLWGEVREHFDNDVMNEVRSTRNGGGEKERGAGRTFDDHRLRNVF